MQSHRSEAGPSSQARPVAISWRTSVEKLKGQGDWPALALLKVLLFMDPHDLPGFGYGSSAEVPNQSLFFQGLAKPSDFIEAVTKLIHHSLISIDTVRSITSFDSEIYTAIYASMSKAEKQDAYNDAAFILSSLFPGKLRAGEDKHARWLMCKRYFPHILSHLARASESDLVMSEYSTVVAINAARYALEIDDFKHSKYLLQIVRIDHGKVTAFETVLYLAKAVNDEAWMNAMTTSHAPADSMTKRTLDFKLAILEKNFPALGAPYGNLAKLKHATGDFRDSVQYSELCLGICMRNEPNEHVDISCKYLYDGWCSANRGGQKEAEDAFEEAIVAMRAHKRKLEAPNALYRTNEPKFGSEKLYNCHSRQEEGYKKRMAGYATDTEVFGIMSPGVFTSLYKLAWYSAQGSQFINAWGLAETLIEGLANEYYKIHIARTQYHVADVLERFGEIADGRTLKEKACAVGKECGGPNWKPLGGLAAFNVLVEQYGG